MLTVGLVDQGIEQIARVLTKRRGKLVERQHCRVASSAFKIADILL